MASEQPRSNLEDEFASILRDLESTRRPHTDPAPPASTAPTAMPSEAGAAPVSAPIPSPPSSDSAPDTFPSWSTQSPPESPTASAPPPPRTAPAARAPVRFEAVERLREGRPVASRRAIHMPSLLVAIALGAIVAAAWIPLLSELEAVPVPAPSAYVDASLRWALALTAQRVNGFVCTEGHPPNRLDDVGHNPWDAIRYERTGETQYVLTASGPRGIVRYDSSEPVDALAGSSREALARRAAEPKR